MQYNHRLAIRQKNYPSPKSGNGRIAKFCARAESDYDMKPKKMWFFMEKCRLSPIIANSLQRKAIRKGFLPKS